jgi:hypothetical protein
VTVPNPSRRALPDLAARRTLAYARLSISPAAIRSAPPISSQLRMAARNLRLRNLPASPYYYLKCSAAPEAQKIVEVYYSMPKNQRDLVPIEAYCVAVNVDTLLVLDLITRACAAISRQSSTIIAAINHPAVVEKTVEIALTDDGIKDRMILHKATGFLPSPSGPRTTVNVAANASATSAPQIAVIAPPPEQTIRRLVDRFNDARNSNNVITQAPVQDALPVADIASDILLSITRPLDPLAVSLSSDDDEEEE